MHHGTILLEAMMWPCSFQIQFQKIRPWIFVNTFNLCSLVSYVYTCMQITVAASSFMIIFKFDLSVLKRIWVLMIAKNNSLDTVLTVSVCENFKWQVYFNEVSIHLWYVSTHLLFNQQFILFTVKLQSYAAHNNL